MKILSQTRQGSNWDTMLQWLVDSGAKTLGDIAEDSTPWGNYSNSRFGGDAAARYTGAYEQAKANNLYDVAGNNWHWTQERYGRGSYVLRGGGTTLMGGPCRGDHCPAAIRDPLPGSKYHPNVTFRVALFLK